MPSVPSGPYAGQIQEIYRATSVDELRAIVTSFSAASTGTDAVLYGGDIGPFHSSDIVQQIADHSDIPIVEKTDRGRFLSDDDVKTALRDRARSIYEAGGASTADADTLAQDLQYGSAHPGSTSVPDSFWGETSHDFVASARGDVAVVSTNSPEFRTLGRVEIDAALANPNIDSVGEIPVAQLRADRAAHGTAYVANEVQDAFRNQAAHDLFDDAGAPVLSQELADTLRLTDPHLPAADIDLPLADLSASTTPAAPRPSTLPPDIDARALADRGAAALRAQADVERHLDPADRAALTAPDPAQGTNLPPDLETPSVAGEYASPGDGGPGGLGEDGAGEAESLGTKVLHGADVASRVLTEAHELYEIANDYRALQASHNQFAATDELRKGALEQAGGAVFGRAGAAIAGTLGIESGLGDVVVTGVGYAVGSMIGELGGDAVAGYLQDRSIKLNLGTDGQTYQYDGGEWKTTHLSLAQAGTVDTPAPASQIPTLEMERTTKIAELAIAKPTPLDPNTFAAADPQTGITRTWERTGPQAWSSRVDDCTSISASPELVGRLNLQSQHVTAIGPTSADAVAKAYVTDYYGKKWDRLGPLPDAVATQLHLPSEQTIRDPQTGITWNVDGNEVTMDTALGPNGGGPTSLATQASPANGPAVVATKPPVPPAVVPTSAPTPPAATPAPVPGQTASASAPSVNASSENAMPSPAPQAAPPQARPPTPDEISRVLALRDAAAATNQAYGAKLIGQELLEVQQAQALPSPAVPQASTVVTSAAACAPETPTAGSPPAATATTVPGPSEPHPENLQPETAPTAPAASKPPNAPTVPATPAVPVAAVTSSGQGPTSGSAGDGGWSGIADAIQARLEQLRAAGLSLPDVSNVQPYAARSQTGSFVQVTDDTVAQHVGRGTYQVASVSRDLNGTTPPEGQPVTVSPQGQVSPPQVARSYARME